VTVFSVEVILHFSLLLYIKLTETLTLFYHLINVYQTISNMLL